MKNKSALYLAIGCIGLAVHMGQATAGVPVRDMDERTLQEKYHIAATEEGLTGALQHQEAVVREFAATKLANDSDKAAIRPILDALAAEKVESVKIGLATAAARLGAPEGFDALHSMCEDQSWSPGLRMSAAQSMVIGLGRQECLSDILAVLRSGLQSSVSELGAYEGSITALNLLPRFRQVLPGQLDEMRNLSAMYLKSQAPHLRIAAGMSIRDLGGPWAISQLRAAQDAERDEAVRSSIAKDLVSVGQ